MPGGTEIILPAEATAGTRPVQVIDLYHQVAYKLSEFYQNERSHHFIDLIFLTWRYQNSIYQFHEALPINHRHYFVERYIQEYPCFDQRIRDLRRALNIKDETEKFMLKDGDVAPCGYVKKNVGAE
jgi:hypothetical protein